MGPAAPIEIPVGVGHCLYIRRDCLREVGELDADVFGHGYGEETDFCLRGRRLGRTHVLAPNVFVYHASGRSFGRVRRTALLERSQRLLNLRYPGYSRFIDRYLMDDRLAPVRRKFDEARLMQLPGPFVILVSQGLSGGVQRYVRERCVALQLQGKLPLILKPSEPGRGDGCQLSSETLDLPNLKYSVPSELQALRAVLQNLAIDSMELQHFMYIDPRVIEAIRSLPVPYDVFIHDYAWICPRVTLIDGTGRYCGSLGSRPAGVVSAKMDLFCKNESQCRP